MKLPRPLIEVARKLGPLAEGVAFVGGMIRSALITDPAAGPARPTDDVDLIVDVNSPGDYDALGERLRKRGFQNCTDEGAPLCRFVVDGIRVDVMPIDPSVLGFSNVWYPDAIGRAATVLTDGVDLRIIGAPDFVATKLEAFAARGMGDFLHHDIEDVIALVDGRPELLNELRSASPDLVRFVAHRVREMLDDAGFMDLLPGHLEGDEASQARLPILIDRMQAIAALQDFATSLVAEPPIEPDETPRPPTATRLQATIPVPGRSASLPGASGPRPLLLSVASSNLRAVGYDRAAGLLAIQFNSGHIYDYRGVPPNIHLGLLAAYSKGRYFHQWIRNRYRGIRVR